MNVFYETLSGVLEEIRSEGMEREYVILPEDLKEAEAELKTERKKFEALLENLQGKKKEILESYMSAVEHVHFKEEQRAYYQGIMDGVLLLSSLGLVPKGKNVDELIKKIEVMEKVVCVITCHLFPVQKSKEKLK